jgi:hypothetical protein
MSVAADRYIQQRNSLIPHADRIANKRHGSNGDEEWAKAWSGTFHKEMNRLWKEVKWKWRKK